MKRLKITALLQPVWLRWLEHCPTNQKVTGSMPCQGTCLGYRFSPRLGYMQEATD